MLELVLRLLIGGGVVVGALLLWRRAATGALAARGGPVLRVVARTGLTRNAVVAVVEVDDQRFLVGAAEDGVDLLAALGRAPTGDPQDGATPTTSQTTDEGEDAPRSPTAVPALAAAVGAHGRGSDHHAPGPRIGPLDRLRAMTVRSHVREPIRVTSSASD